MGRGVPKAMGWLLALGASLAVHVGAGVSMYALHRRAAPNGAPPPPQVDDRATGETFELPVPDDDVPSRPEGEEPTDATPAPPSHASPPVAAGFAAANRAPPRADARRPRRAPAAAASGPDAANGTEASSPTGLYGAAGDRSAAPLAVAFTRGFPQAASADPLWRTAPFGAAGSSDVTLTLDEVGHISGVRVGGSPTPALAAGIRRTLALLGDRPFVAAGPVTSLHITATVSPDTVHDGLHGDVFAIGGSFADRRGAAFFALAIGRRIDVDVRSR